MNCLLKLFLTSGTALLSVLAAWAGPSDTLTAYTEQWPPYNFEENGEIRGIATDALRSACHVAGIRCNFQLVPWARAYKVVSNTPDTVLYTTARKPSREQEFLWVGPLLPRTTWVYAKADNPKAPREMRDLVRSRIGIVRDEASQQDLLNNGAQAQLMVTEASNASVLRLMLGDAVDAMVDTEVGMAWNLRSAGVAPGAVRKQFRLADDGAYFFALNLKTDPILVRNLQAALDQIRRDGRLDAIMRQYESRP
jgi:polar amino acid transport system substrate-binding protein